MAEVGASQLTQFAARMDELSQRAQNVLQRYEEHNNQAHATGTLNGQGGTANLKSTAEIHEAQSRIQSKFQMVNDLVRQNAHGYTSADEQNAATLSSVPGQLNYQ